jgi:citrate lyase gamma subunit
MKEEDTNMEIKRPAIAGTLVSSGYGVSALSV